MTEHRMIKEKECKALTGMCYHTRLNLIKEGLFPKPTKLGKRANYWEYEAIMAWIEGRIKSGEDVK